MPGPFCQANSAGGNMCSGRKIEICKHLSYPMIISDVRWTVFLKLLFQSNINRLNAVYVFLEGNELNIAFQSVILILQNYIQRNKLYHGISNIFTVLGTKSNTFW